MGNNADRRDYDRKADNRLLLLQAGLKRGFARRAAATPDATLRELMAD